MDFLLQTFNSFDDFLDEDEDDGDYKSPSNEDYFTSGGEMRTRKRNLIESRKSMHRKEQDETMQQLTM